jgi:DNA-binding phage protein
MNKSTPDSANTRPGQLLDSMRDAATRKFGSLGGWARTAGLPKETLSRLRSQHSCDLRTLVALATAAGFIVQVAPAGKSGDAAFPQTLTRELESQLLDLAASGNTDIERWQQQGSSFFMGGLAVLLAGARGFERERYLRLAESLHPGISAPEVFGQWLRATPLRAARFLPMARKRKGLV